MLLLLARILFFLAAVFVILAILSVTGILVLGSAGSLVVGAVLSVIGGFVCQYLAGIQP